MNNIIIGNIIALIASLLMVYSGLIKNKDKFIYIQTIYIGLLVISNLVLGGFTGAIINFISCFRNILCYKNKLHNKEKLLIIIPSILLSLYFNNLGIIGLLPVIYVVVYTLFMNIKDIIKFKKLVIFTSILWLIYDICIKSYTSAIFDFLTIITNIFAIFKLILKD